MARERQWPLYAALLVGGASRRMGRPKQLLGPPGNSWAERLVSVAARVAERVVICGAGELPSALAAVPRLADATDAVGPMAGLLAAMRSAPDARWLLLACDLPALDERGLRFVLAHASPEACGVMPRRSTDATPEPLGALYDPRLTDVIEERARSGRFGLWRLGDDPRVATPILPVELLSQWRDADTVEDAAAIDPSIPPWSR